MQIPGYIACTALVFSLLSTQAAQACRIRHPLNFADIVHADIVIEAQVLKYDPNRWASITVATRRTILGDAPAQFSFGTAAPGYSFKVVPELHLGERRIFALWKRPAKDPAKTTSPNYFLISEPCTNTFAFPIYGDVVRAIDLIFDDDGDPKTEARAFARFLGMTGRN